MRASSKFTVYLAIGIEQETFLKSLSSAYSLKVDSSDVECPVVTIEDKGSFFEKQLKLKPRDMRILGYLRKGLTYKEIAANENITIDGVRYYTKKLYRRLNVRNARAAIGKFF
jgi:DNA-binding CsgD family transcriptional regulator